MRGGFTLGSNTTKALGCGDLYLSDLDGDGLAEILGVGANQITSSCAVAAWQNLGGGSFAEPYAIKDRVGLGFLSSLAATDFSGDGNVDIVAVSPGRSTPSGTYFWAGNGDGSFAPSLGDPPQRNSSVRAADFDEDGFVDIVTSGSQIAIQHYVGPHEPVTPIDPEVPTVPTGESLDLNVDGRALRTTARRLARGYEATGSCAPACQVNGGLTVSKRVARKLRLSDTLLVSGDAIWDGDGALELRPGSTGRRALKAYRGRSFKARLTLSGSYLSPVTGEPVVSEPQVLNLKVMPPSKRRK
jgi:hypothetical protein